MALLQVLTVAACLACLALRGVRAGPLLPLGQEPEPFDNNPQYSYSYSVQDAVTGDSKGHSETRNGDVVQGEYTVLDADGTRRIVQYTADGTNGFRAVVRREGSPHALPVAPVAPVIAPVARAVAPLGPVVRAAPFVQYSSPRFSYSVQPVGLESAPVARFAPAPVVAPLARLAIAGPSGVHTSVSTPYHSYSY